MANTIIKERCGVSVFVNHFYSEEMQELYNREIKYLPYIKGLCRRPFNSRYFDKNTDVEIDEPWKAAIRACTLRSMYIPAEIIIDFMVSKGLWEEE